MTEQTDGETLAVLKDRVGRIEARIEKDGEHVWAAIDKLRGCITTSNKELRAHLDEKFGKINGLIIKGGGVVATIMLGVIGYLFIKAMGW